MAGQPQIGYRMGNSGRLALAVARVKGMPTVLREA